MILTGEPGFDGTRAIVDNDGLIDEDVLDRI